MNRLFNPDNPFIVLLNKVADLVIINFFTLLLCIPIFTAGAALTANYYCCLKLRRDEESGIVKMYFQSFKENFKQSVGILFIILLVYAIPAYLIYLTRQLYVEEVPTYISVLLSAAILLVSFLTIMVFPVLSRFGNSTLNTFKTAILVSFSNPFRTLLIMIMTVAPFYLTYNFLVLLPIVAAFGVSLPSFLAVCLYNKQFLKMEKATYEELGIPEPGSEDEHIFAEHEVEEE